MAFAAGKFTGPKFLDIDIDVLTDDATALQLVGEEVRDHRGRKWTYVKFGATTAKGDACYVSAASVSIPITVIPTSARTQTPLGISPIAHTANYFGWLLTEGLFEDDAKVVSASVQNGEPVNPSATAGAVDLRLATDLTGCNWVCIVDDTDNTGSVFVQ